MELQVAGDALDADPAVHRLERKIGPDRHRQAEAHRPPLALAGLRAFSPNRPTVGHDGDLLGDLSSACLRLRSSVHLGLELHVVTVRSRDGDAAVRARVDRDAPGGRQRLLPDLTVAVVVVIVGFLAPLPDILGSRACGENQQRSGQDQGAKSQ
ncbi:MAG: hypothetical protein P8Y11_11275 [Gemmatimonadales bacterium]